MNKQFVTYDIALKLKELGFDEQCIAYYVDSQDRLIFDITGVNNFTKTNYSSTLGKHCQAAPLWQQVIDFFRDVYGIHIDLDYALGWGYGFIPVGTTLNYDWSHFEDGHYWTYYEAREQALLKAIELIQYETKAGE